jgi:hypothetical protein
MPTTDPIAPAPPVPCPSRAPHLPHFYGGDGVDADTAFRCPGRRTRDRQPLPELSADVAWALAQGRGLRDVSPELAHRFFTPAGNLLLTMAQTADELTDRFALDGWKVPVLEYTDALRYLAGAHGFLAAATGDPYVIDGEPRNGAGVLADPDRGQLTTKTEVR